MKNFEKRLKILKSEKITEPKKRKQKIFKFLDDFIEYLSKINFIQLLLNFRKIIAIIKEIVKMLKTVK